MNVTKKSLIIDVPSDLTMNELINLGRIIDDLTQEGDFDQVFMPGIVQLDELKLKEAQDNPTTIKMYIGKSVLK